MRPPSCYAHDNLWRTVARCAYLWRPDRSRPAGAKLSAVTQGSQPSNRSTPTQPSLWKSVAESRWIYARVVLNAWNIFNESKQGHWPGILHRICINDKRFTAIGIWPLFEWKESLKRTPLNCPLAGVKMYVNVASSLLWCFYDFNIYKCGMAIRLTLAH